LFRLLKNDFTKRANKGFRLIKIVIIAVGKTKEQWIREGILHYRKLLKKYVELKLLEIKEETITSSKSAKSILENEAEKILSAINRSSLCIALDVKGENKSSESCAKFFEENLNRGQSEFTFILGGALGLSRKVLDACQFKLSLSQMTFTHEMSRVILLEQIYRALSILKGTKYHK
jgi:23S rRNA (pseudouridine1915-N3)-methyltransferase